MPVRCSTFWSMIMSSSATGAASRSPKGDCWGESRATLGSSPLSPPPVFGLVEDYYAFPRRLPPVLTHLLSAVAPVPRHEQPVALEPHLLADLCGQLVHRDSQSAVLSVTYDKADFSPRLAHARDFSETQVHVEKEAFKHSRKPGFLRLTLNRCQCL